MNVWWWFLIGPAIAVAGITWGLLFKPTCGCTSETRCQKHQGRGEVFALILLAAGFLVLACAGR